MSTTGTWIGRGEALRRLGVKTQTLYAYVSRGRITARPDPTEPRRSLYLTRDIARLTGEAVTAGAAEPLPPPPVERGVLDIRSGVSSFGERGLLYRGVSAVDLAEHATLEDAAALLWGADGPSLLIGLSPRRDAVTGLSARARLFAALARRAAEDAPAAGRTPDALRQEAAQVLNEVVDAVAGAGPRLHFHRRLARAWKLTEGDGQALRRALVLSADAALDPAVTAVRCAASGGAGPAAAALAGMAALVASPVLVEIAEAGAFLSEARRDEEAAIRRRLDRRPPRPRPADPVAESLLAGAHLPPPLSGLVTRLRAQGGVDLPLALALVARRLDLPRDGALDVYLIGRLVGLLAHALDQIIDGSPLRARLRYVGPEARAERTEARGD